MTAEEREKNISLSMDGVPDLDPGYSAGLQNFAPPVAALEDSEARSLLRKAWEKINQGDFEKAGDIFEMSLFEARRALKSSGLILADFITDVGSGLFLCGPEHYQLSADLVQESITIRSDITGEANLNCGRLYRQLASMLTVDKKYTEAVAAMRKTIDIFETMQALGAKQDEKEMARLYKDLAQVLNLEDAAAQVDAPEMERGGLRGCAEDHDHGAGSEIEKEEKEKATKLGQTDYADADVLKQREDS